MALQLFLDDQLNHAYQGSITPFWERRVQQGQFAGENQVAIHYAYAIHPEPQDAVFISSGRIETLLKYKELMYDFYQRGYSVFCIDHRGQGLSGRMTDNPHHGYVESFEHFIADLRQFYQSIMSPLISQKPKLLCHSMGGCIGTLYCMAYPDDFAKMALSAPMYGIRPALPSWLANLLINAHILMTGASEQKPKYFFGQSDYQSIQFEQNVLTQSQVRYQIFKQEYEQITKVQLGGVTSHWLQAAKQAMDNVLQRAGQLNVPVLLMQAEKDQIVDNLSQDRVVARLANCEKLLVKQAQHEILMEKDEIRNPALEKVFNFFEN